MIRQEPESSLPISVAVTSGIIPERPLAPLCFPTYTTPPSQLSGDLLKQKKSIASGVSLTIRSYKRCLTDCWKISKKNVLKVCARSVVSTVSEFGSKFVLLVVGVNAFQNGNPWWPAAVVGSAFCAILHNKQNVSMETEVEFMQKRFELTRFQMLGTIPDKLNLRDLKSDSFREIHNFFTEKIHLASDLVKQVVRLPATAFTVASSFVAVALVDFRVALLATVATLPYAWLVNKHSSELYNLERKQKKDALSANAIEENIISLDLAQSGRCADLAKLCVEKRQSLNDTEQACQVRQDKQRGVLDVVHYSVIGTATYFIMQYSPSLAIAVFLFDQLNSLVSHIYDNTIDVDDRFQAAMIDTSMKQVVENCTTPNGVNFPQDSTITITAGSKFPVINADIFLTAVEDLQLLPGEMVMVTGKSGAGKTTLLEYLALRENAPGGNIIIGQTPIDQIDRDKFRENVFMIRSLPDYDNGLTIREFFNLGRETALDDELIYKVIGHLKLTSKFTTLTEGLESKIKSGSDSQSIFSYGELQRLNIASAILRKPKILIMDEALNHLDQETKLMVFDLLRAYAGVNSATVLMIEHDPVVLDKSDKTILVLDNGQRRIIKYRQRLQTSELLQ